MDRLKTILFGEVNRGENSQASRSSEETTSLPTIESSHANRTISCDYGQRVLVQDVFLSHSGKQKNFIRQLHRDLTNQGVSCFFDQDRDSLPVGEDFPFHIFEAVKTCKVAVLLLSMDYLESKWPMLELSAFVRAKDVIRTNPNLKILPLFFQISPDALKNITANNKRWKQLEKSGEKRAEWHQALNAIRRINGLKFSEGDCEVLFRDQIVREIWQILPKPSPKYHVPAMQGEARMCQEVADFFKAVPSVRKGIGIAGLYGIAGQGKTTLGKAFCNFKLGEFGGKVCHLEFSRGDSFERIKHALHYLTHCPQSHLQTLQCQDQVQVELYRRVKGKRVLLVLDNITEESIDEVTYYLRADLGENSCILLSARSIDVLQKHFKIDKQSCMRVPKLKEEEAIAILLERTCIELSTLAAEDRAFAVKCAHRCSFKDVSPRERTFNPLALKAFGGHLSSKYGSDLSAWVDKIEGWVDRCGYGLDDLLALLGKAFDNMRPEYRTIFMLLALYMPPNIPPHNVTQWLAMTLNKEITFIEKAVEDLCKKSFAEECGPEIRIHDLYIEFAQSKANEMGRWLWWKGDSRSTRGLISQDNAGFELAKLEQCMDRRPSQIAPHDRRDLLVLQLINVETMNRVDLGGMGRLRSITFHRCKDLQSLEGAEKLQQLAWLQISGVSTMFALPDLGSLQGLQHLEINIPRSQAVNQLGDLSGCVFLREINVRCRSLLEFPRLNGLRYLEKVEFGVCDRAKGPLDCRGCEELRSIVLDSCCQMDVSPLLGGCKKLSKIVLWDCDAVTACVDIEVPISALRTLELSVSSEAASLPRSLESCYGLNNLHLWNMGNLEKLHSFRLLSNLTVLKLGKCGIRKPPDLSCCVLLEDVHFFTLRNLECFPDFSSLRKLKKLSLYDCWKVKDPPDISGCNELQVFHLVYNDNMDGLPNMGEFPELEEIKLSWPREDQSFNEWLTFTRGMSNRSSIKRSRDFGSLSMRSTEGGSSAAEHYSNGSQMLPSLIGISALSAPGYEDLESCLERFKGRSFRDFSCRALPRPLAEWEWLKGKAMLVKEYVRGGKPHYSLVAPYE